MDQELETLESRIAALIGNVHRLAEENRRLAAQLAEAKTANADLRDRIAEARSRVKLALERLPGEGQFIGESPAGSDDTPLRIATSQAAAA